MFWGMESADEENAPKRAPSVIASRHTEWAMGAQTEGKQCGESRDRASYCTIVWDCIERQV